MHGKLSVRIYLVAILIFQSTVIAEKPKPVFSDNNPVSKILVVTSPTNGTVPDESLHKSKQTGRFKSGKFFSGNGKKTVSKELVQKIKDATGNSLKPCWLRVKEKRANILILFVCLISILILIHQFRRSGKINRFMTTTRLSVMNSVVQQACRYIEKNHAKADLTVEQMCNDLVTGRAYVEALFKKELGMKVGDFIDQVRINRVKILINKDPLLSLSEIAAATGFSDEKQCLVKFQHICGVDLETYRNKLGHDSSQYF